MVFRRKYDSSNKKRLNGYKCLLRSLGCVATLLGNVMVQALHLGVVSQQIQALAVGLPQELHPGSEQQAICTILSVLSAHSAQQHANITTSSMSIIHHGCIKHLLVSLYPQL